MSIGLGEAIYAAVKPVLKIYVIIFVGFLLAKYNLATVETSRGISNIVVNALLPCLTFNKIVSNISAKDIKEVGVLVITALLIFVTGGACAFITKWATKSPRQWYWGLLFAGVFPNISDLPIAYVQSMSNGSVFTSAQVDRGVAYCCIFLCTQSFLMMNFGLFRLVGLDFREPEKDPEHGLDSESSNSASNPELELKSDSKTIAVPRATHQSWLSDRMKSNHHRSVQTEYSNTEARHSNSNCSEAEETCSLGAPSDAIESLSSDSNYTTYSNLPHNSRRASSSSRSKAPVTTPIPLPRSLHKTKSGNSMFSAGSASSRSRKSGKGRRSSQTMQDVINEYSAANRIKSGEMDLTRPLSLTQEVGEANAFSGNNSDSDGDSENSGLDYESTHGSHRNDTPTKKLSRHTSASSKTEKTSKITRFVQKYKLGWLVYILVNFCRPASLGALLGIMCSMIPWVKALFVHTYVHVHQAPDGQPVLNFLMDFTGYIGNACVPLGLLLLGGTLARLEIKSLPPGFWKTTVMMTVFRLAVLPIIGTAWANKLYDIKWIENDVAKFVVILTWAMPSATAQVYFTAFYTPLEGSHVQMDCLSVFFLSQYAVLFITLSVVVSYALKADLKV
ncbi:LAME_0G11936g1_1 [Lachancea meyersii CBS 8951]|uniref:LAME_0G11936g1_1 n=1 Tax=Lachancea meyersii CBS 8951 TaxID=1266667 RepID=A0A1G4K9J7_9SACH|nr:LAME_0G11936g1_1 [Lachancea meyersii CBS 8951]